MVDWYILAKANDRGIVRWENLQGSDPPVSKRLMDRWLSYPFTAKTIASEGKDSFAVHGEIG